MAAIDEVGETCPQMPLSASMSRLRAGEINMVASTEDATISKSGFFLQKQLRLDAGKIFEWNRIEQE